MGRRLGVGLRFLGRGARWEQRGEGGATVVGS